jgi:hypothetical protein
MRNAVAAGMDLEMPGGGFYTPALLGAAVGNGTVPAAAVDAMALRILAAMVAAGLMDTPQPSGRASANATSAGHDALAVTIAAAAAVLLKNERGALPLRAADRLAVVGPAAACLAPPPAFGFGWPPTVGCLGAGGGSGGVAVLPGQAPSILAALGGRLRRGSSVILPPPFSFIWIIPIGATQSDE